MEKQIQAETIEEALFQFKEFLKELNQNKEINTAQMTGLDDSDEDIRNSVIDYLARSEKHGIRRK
jgi:hypothetical protein